MGNSKFVAKCKHQKDKDFTRKLRLKHFVQVYYVKSY